MRNEEENGMAIAQETTARKKETKMRTQSHGAGKLRERRSAPLHYETVNKVKRVKLASVHGGICVQVRVTREARLKNGADRFTATPTRRRPIGPPHSIRIGIVYIN